MANALIDHAKDVFLALTSCFCQRDATLKLNGRSFKILNLLGEGGFSYVYLAQDLASGRLFALKKIRCPLGSETVKEAMKEVEAYKRFRHPNIIRCLDSCVVQDDQGEGGKIIYLFLPYYKNGTVQHVISANAVNGSHYPEKEMLTIFLGTCEAVSAMHHHGASSSSSYPPLSSSSSSTTPTSSSIHLSSSSKPTSHRDDAHEDQDREEDALIATGELGEGAAFGVVGGIRGGTEVHEEEEEDDAEGGRNGRGMMLLPRGGGGGGGREEEEGKGKIGWAHRDIKPANIMISDDGVTPILMDFGSAMPAIIPIPDRSVALTQQDLAAEHCSMPFRAPELFDVKTDVTLTAAVDIWSLGCTLYAMAYGTSPFETAQQSDYGGSIAMAVLGGKYAFPRDDGGYSEGLRELIKGMLVVKPEARPDIQQIIEQTRRALARLS